MNPLHDEIDQLALEAGGEAPPADIASLQRRAARRRRTRQAVLATAGLALVTGTGWATARLGEDMLLDPAPPALESSPPVPLSAPPQCGGLYGSLVQTFELRAVEVRTSTIGEALVMDVTDAPEITAHVLATESPMPSLPGEEDLGTLDDEGPLLLLGREDGTIIGYSTLLETPGPKELERGAEITYAGYGPFSPCPGISGSRPGVVPPGLYTVNVEATWTTPDGARESSNRPGGLISLTSFDEQLARAPLTVETVCSWDGARYGTHSTVEITSKHLPTVTEGAPVDVTLTVTDAVGTGMRIPAGRGPVLLLLEEHTLHVSGYALPLSDTEVPPGGSVEVSSFGPVTPCPESETSKGTLDRDTYAVYAVVSSGREWHLGRGKFDADAGLGVVEMRRP